MLRQRRPGPEGAWRRGTLTSLEVGVFPEVAAFGLSQLEKVKQVHQAEETVHAKAGSPPSGDYEEFLVPGEVRTS